MNLFEKISEASRPTYSDEMIEARMNWPLFYFKKEITRGIWVLGVDKKSIQAPDAETAKLWAGPEWVLITND